MLSCLHKEHLCFLIILLLLQNQILCLLILVFLLLLLLLLVNHRPHFSLNLLLLVSSFFPLCQPLFILSRLFHLIFPLNNNKSNSYSNLPKKVHFIEYGNRRAQSYFNNQISLTLTQQLQEQKNIRSSINQLLFRKMN